MRKMFHHGNDGYSLVEAILSVFIASIVLCSIIYFASSVVKSTSKNSAAVQTIIQEKNDDSEKIFSSLK